MADRVLGTFPPSLSRKAVRSLEHLGVTPLLEHRVVDIDSQAVTVQGPAERAERIRASTVIWAAGVTASSLAKRLGDQTGAEVDRAGRVTVEPDLTLPGHPEVFAIGDMVRVRSDDGNVQTLPGLAPVAMQEGRYAAKVVSARLRGETVRAFRYRDKGNLATIGRSAGGGRPAPGQAERLPRLGHLARRPPLVPGRLPEPAAGLHPLGVQLLHPRAGRPDHHGLVRG